VSIPRANQIHKIEQKVKKLEQKQKPKKKSNKPMFTVISINIDCHISNSIAFGEIFWCF
jgi:hypothetical protein